MQVLGVRQQLEVGDSVTGSNLDLTSPDMDDGEKALLREMCNVSNSFLRYVSHTWQQIKLFVKTQCTILSIKSFANG